MTDALTIAEDRRDDTLVLALSGPLDLASEPDLRAAVNRHSENDGGPLEVDLRGVTFLDSTGIRGLIAADAAARRYGWELSLVLGPRARRARR